MKDITKMKKSTKEKIKSPERSYLYNCERKEIEVGNNLYKKVMTLTAIVLGTTCGLITVVSGLTLHNKNRQVQPILIPAAVMALSYGSIGKIERHYDRKTEEEIRKLKETYDIRD
jgi:hypothetical protein